MTRAAALAALAALAACDAGTAVLAPVIDLPTAGSEADPLPGLEEAELSVAIAGDPEDLVGKTFARGQRLELPGVPVSDDLVVHLAGRASGSEVAYGRTCELDLRRDPGFTTPHLYFARTVKWAAFGAPSGGPLRHGGLTFATPDGRVLFLGGRAGAAGSALAAVDVFDARAGAWSAVEQVDARRGAVLAPFGDGSALVIGGVDDTGVMVDFYDRIDAASAAALRVDHSIDPRLRLMDHAAATFFDGSKIVVVVIGGRTPDLLTADPLVTGAVWELTTAIGGGLAPPRAILRELATPRAEHTLTPLSDDLGAPLLIAGGVDAGGTPVARAELYKPLAESFEDPALFQPALLVPRRRHTAVRMPDGSVLIAGGLDAAGAPVAQLELFSITGGFQAARELPEGAGLVDFTATPLPDGRVLLVGGRRTASGPPLAGAFIASLDPTNGSVDVVQTDQLAVPRAGHQAILLCDGTVLLVGGAEGEVAPAERYNPPSLGRR